MLPSSHDGRIPPAAVCLLAMIVCGVSASQVLAQDAPVAPLEQASPPPTVDPEVRQQDGVSPEEPSAEKSLASQSMPQSEAGAAGRHALPAELSPWSMFLAADIVVKGVMVGLAAASFLVWTIWLAKLVQLFIGRRRLASDIRAIRSMPNIDAAQRALRDRRTLASAMLDIAVAERDGSGGYLRPAASERIRTRLSEIETQVSRHIRGGMSFLATVAATGPFIGLFGTVWGIMNSFIGISKAQTTNLAVVAPGIAEALLATAIGLVAAIPAVILYNHLGKGIANHRRLARETRGEVERVVSREMEDLGQVDQRRYSGMALAAE